MFPGVEYTPAHPLLYFATKVLCAAGFDVLEIWFDYSDVDLRALSASELDELAAADGGAALEAMKAHRPNGERFAVGKSLGTVHLAGLHAAGSLAGVRTTWLTPLITRETVYRALRQRAEPALVVSGTDDPATPPHLLEDLEAQAAPALQVFRNVGADHALERANPSDTIDALAEMIRTFSRFVSEAAPSG